MDWDCGTANVHPPKADFPPVVASVQDQLVVVADTAFHAADGDPPNLKVCARGAWNQRMLVETVLSMRTVVCQFKKVAHRV